MSLLQLELYSNFLQCCWTDSKQLQVTNNQDWLDSD
jgi:hypothetical protein